MRDESASPQQPARTASDEIDDLLTIGEVASLLKVSTSWVYEHTRAGVRDRLPFVKLGKYLRFNRRDLRAYVDAKRNAARALARGR